MNHAAPLITTLAAAFGLALTLGFVAVRLKLPARWANWCLVGLPSDAIQPTGRTQSLTG